MEFIRYILHLSKDKNKNKPYAEYYKYSIHKDFQQYLQYLGYNLQKENKQMLKGYIDAFFRTIEKELE